MKKDKVAIIGFTTHKRLAPYDDDSFEIWGINDLYSDKDIKRWDRWFQIHHPEHYKGSSGRASVPEMYAEYAKWDCPVYMWQKDDSVPNSVEFPFRDIMDKYGNYFNNTISWLVAFAMYEGFKEIHLYGVDMQHSTEYSHQRPSCEYFIGLARGLGIKVVIPNESSLLKAKYLYALETEREDVDKADLGQRRESVLLQLAEAERTAQQAEAKIHMCRGALVAIDELLAAL